MENKYIIIIDDDKQVDLSNNDTRNRIAVYKKIGGVYIKEDDIIPPKKIENTNKQKDLLGDSERAIVVRGEYVNNQIIPLCVLKDVGKKEEFRPPKPNLIRMYSKI